MNLDHQLIKFYNDFNKDALNAQLHILASIFRTGNKSVPKSVTDIANQLKATEGACILLNEVVHLVKLALVVPASSATWQEKFSN